MKIFKILPKLLFLTSFLLSLFSFSLTQAQAPDDSILYIQPKPNSNPPPPLPTPKKKVKPRTPKRSLRTHSLPPFTPMKTITAFLLASLLSTVLYATANESHDDIVETAPQSESREATASITLDDPFAPSAPLPPKTEAQAEEDMRNWDWATPKSTTPMGDAS